MFHFLYKTTNIITNQYYFGIHSTKNLGDNYLGSGKNLIKDIKKYGKSNFIREIISFADSKENLLLLEKNYINFDILSDQLCYNLAVGGGGGGFYNKKHSQETKEKLRSCRLNKPVTQETRNKIALNNSKRGQTKETREKLRQLKLGKKHSPETKEKIRNSLNKYYANIV